MGLSCEPNIYVSWSTSELRLRLAPWNRFKPSSKIFYWSFHGPTSFVYLLFCSVLCLLCFVRVCLYVLCGHLLGKGWPLGSRLWCLLWVCHFLIGILVQVWYLIVSIPDFCTLTYFYKISTTWHNDRNWVEPAAMVGYRSWLHFLILINGLQDMFCILFAFSQTLLSREATDCLITQEKVSIARNATITHYILVNPYGTVRKRQRMATETWHTEDNIFSLWQWQADIGQMS